MYTLKMRNLSVHKNLRKQIKLNKDSMPSIGLILALLFLTLYPIINPQKAHASVTESFVRFDRLATGSAVTGTACLKTSTSGTETNVVLVFPQGWTVSTTPANW